VPLSQLIEHTNITCESVQAEQDKDEYIKAFIYYIQNDVDEDLPMKIW